MTTNIAARLAALAGPGEIVLRETTRAHLGPDAACDDRGLHTSRTSTRPSASSA
jgi:class 3 adenylate cyclase